MAVLGPGMIAAATALQGVMAWAQTHSADPGESNTANVNTGPRIAVDWATPNDSGNFNLDTALAFTGIAANSPVPYITFWSAQSGGVCTAVYPTAGDLTANASGEVTCTAIPLTGVST